MGKGAGGSQAEVTDYRLSAHWGVCWGPVDAMLGIFVGEKPAWTGAITSEGDISINVPNLFGGNTKEGGVSGSAYWLPGNDNQVMPESLANRMGVTTATCPGYRGTASLFFTGGVAGSGFYWTSNTPYLKTLWVQVRRAPRGLNPATAMIGNVVTLSVNNLTVTCNGATATLVDEVGQTVGGHFVAVNLTGGSDRVVTVDGLVITITKVDSTFTVASGSNSQDVSSGGTVRLIGCEVTVTDSTTNISFGSSGQDANGAHIIFECLTNLDWGMGAPAGLINVASFEAAAVTLFNEGFGLSLAWVKSTTIEAFVSEVVDHILATVFVNPSDGLITIKLIRDDYNPADLPTLTPDNCTIKKFDRKLWGETINEIVVTWTNPVNESEETVSAQDLANCSIQGNIVSQSRNYYAVRNAELAMRLALRDLRSVSAPLASFQIEVDRSAWNFVPGGLARLYSPEDGIDGVILRIGKIDYGKPGAPSITVNAIEDIFGLPTSHYTAPPVSQWVDPASDPAPMAFARVITMPRYFVENTLNAQAVAQSLYPEVTTLLLAAQNDTDTFDYDLLTTATSPTGVATTSDLGLHAVVGRAALASALAAEPISTITPVGFFGPRFTAINTFVMIGDVGETAMEIALITGSDGSGITLARGLLDTVPHAWAAGTALWFAPINIATADTTVRAAGEIAQYKLLTRTSRDVLAESLAPIVSQTLTDRPWRPNRPGNVKIGGVGFATVEAGTASSLPLTWANRNRLMEPLRVIRWTDNTVTPEAGQTTTVTLMKSDRTVLATYAGLTGTSFDIPIEGFHSEAAGIVRVTAVRDGLESLQGHEISVTITVRGYGRAYGTFYGGGGDYVPITPVDPPAPPPPDPVDPWNPPHRQGPYNPLERDE
ncbi:phage tail protein [Sphingomonas sp. RB3P16]|uniref:phage tail protein n=1 Tax=Parasphingomonas frigoris TaxID=3096163 RepID=UPI002FCB1E03